MTTPTLDSVAVVALDAVARSSIILLVTALVVRALSSAAATTRHAVLAYGLVLAFLIPALSAVLPEWEPALLPAPRSGEHPEGLVTAPDAEGRDSELRRARNEPRAAASPHDIDGPTSLAVAALGDPAPRPADTKQPRAWGAVVAIVWGTGVLAVLLRLGLGIARLRRRTRRSVHAPFRAALDAECERLGIRRTVELRVHRTGPPMTWGVIRPIVSLPADARRWPADRLWVVLRHELLHVRRLDWLFQVLARVFCALYWFNPLAWMAARRLVLEQELACDEDVVAAGTRPSDYARHLTEVALSLVPCEHALALPIVRSSPLEERIMTILATRPGASRRLLIGVSLLLTCAGAVIASAHPRSRTPEVRQDSVMDDDGIEVHGYLNGSFVYSATDPETGLRMVMEGEAVLEDGRVESMAEDGRIRLRATRGPRIDVTIEPTREGSPAYEMRVDGTERQVDEVASTWIRAAVRVLESSLARSHVMSERDELRAHIDEERARRDELRARIDEVHGARDELEGAIDEMDAERDELAAEIDGILADRDELLALLDELHVEEDALERRLRRLERRDPDGEALARVREELADVDAEQAEVEAELEALEVERRVRAIREKIEERPEGDRRAIESRVESLDVAARTRDLEERIAALDTEQRVSGIQREIESLDADRKLQELEAALDASRRELERAARALR